MAQKTRYRLEKVMVEPGEARASTWTFGGEPMSGIEQTYAVRDANFPARNIWEFVVRIPRDSAERIEVRPDWRAVDTIRVVVSPQLMRPPRRSTGRALQLASDPAQVTRDGVVYPRPVSRWTWYADDRVRWRLRP